MCPGRWRKRLRGSLREGGQELGFAQLLMRTRHRHILEQGRDRLLQNLCQESSMRGAYGTLGSLAAVHFRQTPVLVASPAVKQAPNVEKPSQQPGDQSQSICFKVLESRF